MKAVVTAAAILAVAGCRTTTSGNAQSTQGAPAGATSGADAGATTSGGSTSGAPASGAAWMSLSDGATHPGSETPKGLYVSGTVVDGAFQPSGDVQGDGTMGGDDGQPGWIDLRTGKFHSDTEATAPRKPYVKAVKAGNGSVAPTTRTVTY